MCHVRPQKRAEPIEGTQAYFVKEQRFLTGNSFPINKLIFKGIKMLKPYVIDSDLI